LESPAEAVKMVADNIGYDWITLAVSSGVIASLVSMTVDYHFRLKDEAERKRKMLYYPLCLACRDIIRVINDYKTLGDSRSRKLFMTNAKLLDNIYSNQEIIYLEPTDLNEFLKLKSAIDLNFQSFERRNWEFIEDLFENEDFELIKDSANNLLSICQREVKELRNLPGEME
jgi:hypothetical protein